MTTEEYEQLNKRLDNACLIQHEIRLLQNLKRTIKAVCGEYFHLTTLGENASQFIGPGQQIPKVPVSAISGPLEAWIEQEEKRLTDELSKL
jgi:hypothetical protein